MPDAHDPTSEFSALTPEDVVITPVRRFAHPVAAKDACLVHIHPPGPSLGRRYPLPAGQTLIGRANDVQIHCADPGVSRRHAGVEPLPDGRYRVSDLGSANGTYLNDVAVSVAVLADGDYLRVGSAVYRYLAGGNVEAEYHEELYRLTVRDPLTGLDNRRSLDEFLDREVERARRHCRPLAALMFDVDHFKSVNDRLGHLAGDMVLKELASRVRDLTRRDELLARYGGEEFVLVLPEADPCEAAGCGERVRGAAADRPITVDRQELRVTVSVGVGVMEPGEDITPEVLLARADEYLYAAKRGGRNRVCAPVVAGPR